MSFRKGNDKILLNIIFSNLLKESRDNLNQRFKNSFIISSYQKPLFDYISFCRHLNFIEIKKIINNTINVKSEISNIEKEILKLFINKYTNITHLYIPHKFNHELNLLPGVERCFSELKSLSCNTTVKDEVLNGLTKICKSINELDLFIEVHSNNYEIVKLIETPKKLLKIRLMSDYYSEIDESFYKVLENSLILHSNNVQHFKITKQPITNILSSLINLKRLELDDNFRYGLYIIVDNTLDGYGSEFSDKVIDWNSLFEILAKSSPINLFKFKIYYQISPKSEFIKSFFDKWKGRHPMLLQFIGNQNTCKNYFDLIEKYKAEGIIKKCDDALENTFEDFEWIQKRFNK
ncbi:unnamed protein product [Rhizophagus irregularis]|nr:unnamed protein product [Rhizophagus irregularis]